jgi:predicted GTPase
MPANLPPQYYDAEKRYRAARTPEDKIEAIETMLAIMPRHKGTDHLYGDLRRRIAKLQEEAERKAATSRASFYIRKEGAGQVALVGLPNTGKSQLLAALSDALPEIAEYPFTTKSPNIGMMKFETIQIQLVDTPPVTGRDSRVWLNNVARNADLIVIVVDLSKSPVEQTEVTLQELDSDLEKCLLSAIKATSKQRMLGGDDCRRVTVPNSRWRLYQLPAATILITSGRAFFKLWKLLESTLRVRDRKRI